MKRDLSILVCFAMIFGITGTLALAGTVDFEGMPQDYWFYGGQVNFGSYWAGAYFGPESTILEDQVYGYNSSGYPPHSGHAVLFSISTPYIKLEFDSPVDFVSLWYSSPADFYFEAYDSSDTLIDSIIGAPNSTTNSYLELSSLSSNIKYVMMHDTGNYFTVDDITAPILTGEPSNGEVPEPATMILLGSGLVGLAGYARKRMKK